MTFYFDLCSNIKSGQVKPRQVKSRTGQFKSGLIKSTQINLELVKSSWDRSSQVGTGQVYLGKVKTHSQIKWHMRLHNLKKIQIHIFGGLLYHIHREMSFQDTKLT